MSDPIPSPRGSELTDVTELLLRQVHPMFMQAGRVTSQAFRPGRSDGALLSTSRGALSSPEAAWRLHTTGKALRSVGVWGVTVQEFNSERLRCFADPDPGPPPDPAHALVDFRELGRGECEARAKRIVAWASARGCLFAPPDPIGT